MEQTEAATEETPETVVTETARRLQPLHILILALVSVVVLTGAIILGLNLSRGTTAPELPTFTPTMTSRPTMTPTHTVTPTPTETPAPTETPTPIPPIEYIVQAGDTLGEIAVAHDVTTDQLVGLNNLEGDVIQEGQTLLIPPPTPTPGPTPTSRPGEPTPTPAPFVLHTVRSGDTLSTIAEAYDVTVEEIRRANDLAEDTEIIQTNTVLTIPRPTPTPEPEVIANVTPTPTPGLMSYPAPQLLYPPDDSTFVGPDTVIALQWASVGILDDREYYELEFIRPTEEGRTTEQIYTRSTVWRVPVEFFPLETVEDNRFAWRVLVVRQISEGENATYKILSQAGARRNFTWLPAAPETE